jgi:hypothetical protein
MPYRSEKQRKFMHAKHPDIASRWDAKYGGKVKPGKKKRKSLSDLGAKKDPRRK